MATTFSAFGHIDEIAYLDANTGGSRERITAIPRGALLTLRGWAALVEDPGFAAGVFVMLDGGPPTEMVYGIERRDVATVMRDESFAMTGFRGILATSHLDLGEHRVTVAIRNGDGTFVPLEDAATVAIEESIEQRMLAAPTATQRTAIVVDDLKIGMQFVTEPVPATQGDFISIRGWAFDEPANALATNVYATVGSTVVSAEYGSARADVAAHRNDERFCNCGFSLEIPLDAVAPGHHAIRLRVLGADGQTIYEGQRIAVDVAPFATGATLSPGGRPTLGTIDSTTVFDMRGHVVSNAAPLTLKRGDQLLLSGWAIDEPGDAPARGVHVCVDGIASTPAVYGLERRDVARHFHRPDLTDCGFTAILGTGSMPAGSHTAELRVIDRTGTRFYDTGQRIEFVVSEATPG